MNDSTITAVATPLGSGGIGIIRISGQDALTIAESIFIKKQKNEKNFESHRLYLGNIIDKEKEKKIDEVLLTVMKAPNSYTREDVVEINAHSGVIALNEILRLILKKGARLAQPGEFTKRAFINGRIDLTQAEAVIDIINAKSEKSLEIANSQIEGRLKRKISSIRESLIQLFCMIEAGIDFPEEEIEDLDNDAIKGRIETEVLKPLKQLLNNFQTGHVFKEGIRLVVAGKPNVGKSSLMNRMANKERAIVTALPGTTRDIIEETIKINGIPAIITDTAGLHHTKDTVEVLGIEKAYEQIKLSDIVLFMIDASSQLSHEDYKIFQELKHKKKIIVINKIDLAKKNGVIEIPESWHGIKTVKISALYHKGIDKLNSVISKMATGEATFDPNSTIIPNIRHKREIEKSLNVALRAKKCLEQEMSFELMAIDFQEAIDSLGKIIGVSVKEEIVERIFEKFCIGK